MSRQQLDAESVPRADGLPMLGIGTWENTDPEECAESVRTALETGYRHVDTAQAYGNEEAVGEGIDAADVPREEIFLATKVDTGSLAHDDVIHSTTESLDRLGVSSLDLLYVHWPLGEYDPEDTLSAFDELHDRGAIDRVGVSNFEPEHLDTAREVLDAPLFANQVECHPLLPQAELREYAAAHDHQFVAYSPLARGEVLENDVLTAIGENHDASAAQVSLAWLREKGVTAIPKATGAEHVRDNWGSVGLDLHDEEIERIDAIDRTDRQVDPDDSPW